MVARLLGHFFELFIGESTITNKVKEVVEYSLKKPTEILDSQVNL